MLDNNKNAKLIPNIDVTSQYEYNIFGSQDSTDYDIMVLVDERPDDIESCHQIITRLNNEFAIKYEDKKINCNLCTVSNGVIDWVFKGTTDECNNSIYYTYNRHSQSCECFVMKAVTRDIDIKILRVYRFFMTIFSRIEPQTNTEDDGTIYQIDRTKIKEALRGNLIQKIEVLDHIKMLDYDLFGTKKVDVYDGLKAMAFQVGQLSGLMFMDAEYYSKQGILSQYPMLEKFLYRQNNGDLAYLYYLIIQMNIKIRSEYSHLLNFNEHTYVTGKN